MPSLRQALKDIGVHEWVSFHVRADFGRRTPHSLLTAMAGMTDPHVSSWSYLGIALARENTDTSDNVQGVTTDGALWYVVANADDGLAPVIGVYDNAHQTVKKLRPASAIESTLIAAGDGTPHFGAPCFRNGHLHVPIQSPHALWRLAPGGGNQTLVLLTADNQVSGAMPWCDIHPVTDLLYTSKYDIESNESPTLFAYKWQDMTRVPTADIVLQKGSMYLDRVQGGVFTDRGRVLLSRTEPNRVHCYSALNGHYFGARDLTEIDSEGEGITVRAWNFGASQASVHVLEQDIDPDPSDFYLHSYGVPDPARL
jgi:hypothetical protein